MDLDALFARREDWQRNAFETIKHNLLSAKDNRFVRYDGAQEEHLVMIYGKSQVGKTTLILTMMGIRDAKRFQEVDKTLRAGISRGNSSTSTAIVYSRSGDDRYGCAVTTIDSFPPREVPSFDSEGMIQRLQEVRADVEANRADAGSILYITIPNQYFDVQASKDHVSILDMPGIGSRNHKEDEHVRNLMIRYFPIASACIIACRSNDIQSLETLELPDQSIWKRMEHRFVLTVTHAYNNGSIKSYFQKERGCRQKGFHQHITDSYTEDIRSILGEDNQTEIFPLDLGDSMESLLQSLPDDRDRQEVLETQDKVLSDLRAWITGHRENRLKAAIANLRDVVERAGEEAIQKEDWEAGKIREEMAAVQRGIEHNGNLLQYLTGDGGQLKELQAEYDVLHEKRQLLMSWKGVVGLYWQLEERLEQEGLAQNDDGAQWKDPNQRVYPILRGLVVELAGEEVKALKPVADISGAVRSIEIDQWFVDHWKKSSPMPRGWFGIEKKDRVCIDKLQNICEDAEDMINKALDKAIQPHKRQLDGEFAEKKLEIRNVEHSAQSYQIQIRQLEEKTKKLGEVLADCMDRRVQMERRQQQDQRTLDMYRKYTKEAHEAQRRELVDQINSKLPPGDKLVLILFLGILDRDYQKVTGGVYETGN